MDRNFKIVLDALNPSGLLLQNTAYYQGTALYVCALSKITYFNEKKIQDYCIRVSLRYNKRHFFDFIKEPKTNTQFILWAASDIVVIRDSGTALHVIKNILTNLKCWNYRA